MLPFLVQFSAKYCPNLPSLVTSYLGWYCLSWLVERRDWSGGAMCEDRLSPPACDDISPVRGSGAIAADDRRTVTILLCTLNGERFLAEQLASLERQTFKNWKLIASDDGSTDRTKSILRALRKSSAPGTAQII